jgi:hypothetical protein
MHYRIQFLDGSARIVRELVADARNAVRGDRAYRRYGLTTPRLHNARDRRRRARGSFGDQAEAGPPAQGVSARRPRHFAAVLT